MNLHKKNGNSLLLNIDLEANLRLIIKFAYIYLISTIKDEYIWILLSKKEYLFWKQLSKHLTEVYMKLYWGVDISFETITESVSTEKTKKKVRKIKILKFILIVR